MENIAGLVLAWVLAVLFGLVMPLILIFVRNSIRDRRQIYITYLQKTLFAGVKNNPSFEFVKNRYFVNGIGHRDIHTAHLIWSAVPLFMASVLGISLALAPISQLLGDSAFGGAPIVASFLWVSSTSNSDALINAAAAGAIAFVGAYYATIRQLVRSTINFDLTPATLLRETTRLLGGFVLGVLVWRVVGPDGFGSLVSTSTNATTNALWIPVIFWVGYAPDFGLATLLRYLRITWFKTVDSEVLREVPAVPLEVISGIDYETRYRLEETNISDIQNLATCNPIQLHIETPFGLFQTIDWVAQAQLCCAVGPRSFVRLRQANIRTILDLERAVLAPKSTPELRQLFAHAVFAQLDDTTRNLLRAERGSDGSPPFDDATIRQMVRLATDDLHVQRLRQLWHAIGEKLGPDNAWLKFDDGHSTSAPEPTGPEAAANGRRLPARVPAVAKRRANGPKLDSPAGIAAAGQLQEVDPSKVALSPAAPAGDDHVLAPPAKTRNTQ